MNKFIKVESGTFVRAKDIQIKKGLEISKITVKITRDHHFKWWYNDAL